MADRDLVLASLEKKNNSGKNALWLGTPTADALKIYYAAAGIDDPVTWRGGRVETEFHKMMGADMVRISPEFNHHAAAYKHPEGRLIWDPFTDKHVGLSSGGVFEEAESVEEIENYPFWPDPQYLDFTAAVEDVKYAVGAGMVVFGSMISDIFTLTSNYFGMEEYFVKMYTDPEVVHAVTERITDFYLAANRKFIEETRPYLTGGFFSMDLGTQLAPLISPEMFDEFVAPYLGRLIAQFKDAGLKFALHSCGAIEMLIPRLIDLGVDMLNPLQAKAVGMEPEKLAAKYGGRLTFCGGVDAQELLPNGTPEQVRECVLRLRDIFKGDLIVSPSHDSLLPDVPFENVVALCEAAKE